MSISTDALLDQVDVVHKLANGTWICFIDIAEKQFPGVRVQGKGATPRAAMRAALASVYPDAPGYAEPEEETFW